MTDSVAKKSKSNWRQDMPTQEAYWMNRVLYDIHHDADELKRFLASREAYLADIPLSATSKAAIQNDDIATMYLSGVNPYVLRAHCLGLHLSDQVFVGSLKAITAAQLETQHG